jgi:peptidoglycan/LPS O-acetylase OafA/YrhL
MKISQDIQFLRGIALLMVLLFHLNISFFKNGYLGVDIFFVISGFLMAKLYCGYSTLAFYKRRLDRLFPAYAFTILLTLSVGAFFLVPIDFSQLYTQSIGGLFLVSNILYWSQVSYFNADAFNPLLNLWSLSVEAQFYLIVPLLYPLIKLRKSIFFLIFITSLCSCFVIQSISPKTSFFFMPLRIWEFLIGYWFAWNNILFVPESKQKNKYYQALILLSLIVFPIAINLKPDSTGTILFGHPAVPALVTTLLTGMAIKFGIPHKFLYSIGGKLISKIGDYSYSIYLVHFPIIVLLNYTPFEGTKLAFDSLSLMITAIILTFIVGTLSYTYIEKSNSALLSHTKFKIFICLLILILAFILNKINLSRYNLTEKNISLAYIDRDTYRCGKIARFTNPFGITCQISATNKDGGVLLIGDSHADSIKRSFSRAASEDGISTYFVVSNDPLTGAGPDENQLIEEAKKLNIGSIVIHFSNVYDRENVRRSVLNLVKMARANNIKAFFIGPVPTYNISVPQAMFFHIEKSGPYPGLQVKNHNKSKDYLDFKSSLEAMGVKIFDPTVLLCPTIKSGCLYSTSDSRPFYFDSNHLTITGSNFLMPLFEKIVGQR